MGTPPTPRTRLRRAAPALALAALLAAGPALASMERAREAQARGDLRTAQIELRNFVRANPQSAPARAALAELSLDLGDGDTAEKEARAALERGYDRVAGTGLLLRAYLMLGRHRDLLRDFPVPADPGQAALAGRIAAGRALAQLRGDDRAEARDSVGQALRLAPGAPEPHLAAAALATAEGDRAAAEAAVDRALAADPASAEATMRKAALLYGRGEPAAAAEALAPLVARQPANAGARVLRADALLRLGRDAEARTEVDAALRTQPNNAAAGYLRALLLGRAGDWRGADEVFQRLSPALGSFADGFLMAATARRQVGQAAQAEDLAARHVARNPEDPRGAKLLAAIQLEANRPDAAIGVLARLAERGAADAEAFALLGQGYGAARRPREAMAAFERAVALAPEDAGLRTRLAAARLAVGDVVGAAEAAAGAGRIAPDDPRLREVNAAAAIARGDLGAAEAELAALDPAARRSEAAGVLAATVRLGRLDLAAARAGFEAVLREHPDSLGARLGLARALAAAGDLAGAEAQWAAAALRDPANAEALGRLGALARPGGPRAASARAALEAAQAAAGGGILPALTLATALAAGRDLAGAAAVLETEPLRAAGRGTAPALLRSQIYVAQSRWAEAEAELRTVLGEEPDNAAARRQLAILMGRDNRAGMAEALVQEGLRRRPADMLLQQTLVGLVRDVRGEEAALAVADALSRQPEAQPTSRALRGDYLLARQRPADAAAAYAAAQAEAPSALLALRLAAAWRAAGQPARAVEALEAWLLREPDNLVVMDQLAGLDLALGRKAEAERRLATLVERAPTNAAALNNLAWLLAERGDPATLPRARGLAERGYYLAPGAQTADTLGWVLARSGEPARAVPLLRDAAAATNATQAPDRGISFRLAHALRSSGDRAGAIAALEPALAGTEAFPERAEAERLLAELRAGR